MRDGEAGGSAREVRRLGYSEFQAFLEQRRREPGLAGCCRAELEAAASCSVAVAAHGRASGGNCLELAAQAALSALPGLFAACEFACVVTAMRVSEHEDMSGISEAMGGVKRAIRGMAGGAGGIREFLFLVSLAEGERKASFDIILAGRPAA